MTTTSSPLRPPTPSRLQRFIWVALLALAACGSTASDEPLGNDPVGVAPVVEPGLVESAAPARSDPTVSIDGAGGPGGLADDVARVGESSPDPAASPDRAAAAGPQRPGAPPTSGGSTDPHDDAGPRRQGRIAFASSHPNGASWVSVSDPDGSNTIALSVGWEPQWSPDGRRIALTRPSKGGGQDLVLVSADGSSETVVYHWPHLGGLGDATFSPDGDRLAFATAYPPGSRTAGPAAQTQIRTVRADGTDERIVVATPGENTFPEWSPDGGLIAFTAATNGAGKVSVVRPDGTGLRTVGIQTHDARSPSWSPDGSKLAFVAFDTANDFAVNLWVVHRDGSGLRRLGPAGLDSGETGPAWSPDGRRIAFEDRGIVTVRPDGSDRRRLSSTDCGPAHHWACDHNPAWSPDGRFLAFVADTTRGSHLITAEPDGSNRREAPGAGFAVAPVWRP